MVVVLSSFALYSQGSAVVLSVCYRIYDWLPSIKLNNNEANLLYFEYQKRILEFFCVSH